MQITVKNLLVTGTRIALGVAVGAPSAAPVAAVCASAGAMPVVAVAAEEGTAMADRGGPEASVVWRAVYTVTTAPTPSCDASAHGQVGAGGGHARSATPASHPAAPRLEQWAIDASGAPLPWISALAPRPGDPPTG